MPMYSDSGGGQRTYRKAFQLPSKPSGSTSAQPAAQNQNQYPVTPERSYQNWSPAEDSSSYNDNNYYSGNSSSSGGGGGWSSDSGSSGGGGGWSGGSSGGGGGGGGGATQAMAAPAPPPPPPPVYETVKIPDPKVDPVYQQQITQLARNMADFKSQQGLAQGQYRNQYNASLGRLGWNHGGFDNPSAGGWDVNKPGLNQYADSTNANSNDFAGRGVYNSGMYLKSQNDLNSDFNDRKTTMDTSRNDWVNTQAQNLHNLESQQEQTRSSSLQDAIARIAATVGVDLSQVTPGKVGSYQKLVG